MQPVSEQVNYGNHLAEEVYKKKKFILQKDCTCENRKF